jgi:hypothetical protein
VESVQLKIEIDSLQVILARAPNNDGIPRMLDRPGHKTAKLMRDAVTCQFSIGGDVERWSGGVVKGWRCALGLRRI